MPLTARITVTEDHKITGVAPADLPAGEHEVIVLPPVLHEPSKPFDWSTFPSHDEPWDESNSLRREDLYGDEGR